MSLPSIDAANGSVGTDGAIADTPEADFGGSAGSGTVVGTQPYLIQGDDDTVGVVTSAAGANWFQAGEAGTATALTPMFDIQDALNIVNAPASDGGTTTPSGYNQEYEMISAADGARSYFHTFSPLLPAALQGKFIRSVDPAGNTTAAAYFPDGSGGDSDQIESLTNTTATGGVTGTQTLDYAYLSSGANAGLISSITLLSAASNVDGGTPVTVRVEDFAYYSSGAVNGVPGQLETATVLDSSGNVVDSGYYRYWSATDPAGDGGLDGGALKYYLGSDAYVRLQAAYPGDSPDSLSDADVAPFADNYFSYNDGGQIATATTSGTGCSSCSGGLGTITYTYVASTTPSTDFDVWQSEQIATLPNGTQDLTFSNFAGQTMLSVVVNTSGQQWPSLTQFDTSGRTILTAGPSAFAPVDGNYYDTTDPTLVGYNESTLLSTYLSNSAGLINLTNYYDYTDATATTPGGAQGYEQNTEIEQGQEGTPILQESMAYYAVSDSGGSTGIIGTVYPLATDTTYANIDGSGARVTTYTYTWASGTTHMTSETTTLPSISTDENGNGATNASTQVFNSNGQDVWSQDAQRFLTYNAYDPATGALVKTIQDVDTSDTSDYDATLLPSGWTTPTGGGLNLVTTCVPDSQGRTTKMTDPNGNVTYTVYTDGLDTSTGFVNEVRTYPGWHYDSTLGKYTTTGPVQVTRQNRTYSYTESLTYAYTPVSGVSVPTGADTIDSSNIQSLSRQITNSAGQVIEDDAYTTLSGVTYSPTTVHLGTAGTNYYATTYAYDVDGRQCKVVDPNGTITRTVFDAEGRPSSTWIGTNDTPTSGYWSSSNPASMTMVSLNVYDNGGIGDGNLTQTTAFPGGSAAPRITQSYFDWRDRQVASKSGVLLNEDGSENTSAEDDGTNRPIEFSVYDNLGEVTEQDTYTGDGIAVTTTGGVVNAPSSDLLRAETTSSFDDQGNVYQTSTYSVDPSDGDVGDAITTDTFRDLRGDVIATYTPGQPTEKSVFDGAGRDVIDYTTDGGAVNNDGTPLMDYADASSVSNDVVVSQTEHVDDADGDEIETIESDRLPEDSTSAEGALGDASGTGGPAARVSYDAMYYDDANRETAEENVGTYGGAAWTRPSTPDASDATHLVSLTTYNSEGLAGLTIDPRGIKALSVYNMLGQSIETIAAYTGTSASDLNVNADVTDATPTNDTNQTTTFTFDGDGDETSQTAVMPSGTNSQTTAWIYGVSTSTGSTIDSNDLLYKEEFPSASTGDASTSASDDVTNYYDNLGETIGSTDQNGTTQSIGLDVLGRPITDSVTTLGSGVDGTVRLRTTAYDTQGNPYLMTAYGSTLGGTVLNQVEDVFNGLDQLTGEYQADSGAVATTGPSPTPETQYAYSDPTSGSLMTSMTYPNGRELDFGYTNNALDTAIGRVDFLADAGGSASGHLVDYLYMGLSTMVQQADANGDELTYLQQSGDSSAITSGPQYAGDEVTGLNTFGQVDDQNWVNTTTPTPTTTDRLQYNYDQDGDVLYSDNLLSSANSELFHSNSTASGDDNTAYDPLERLTAFARGTLSASSNNGGVLDTVSSPSLTQSWSLDAVGNQTAVTTNGTAVDNTANSKNELTVNGSNDLAFDNNGDTLTDQAGNTYTYNSWDEIATVKNSSGTTIAAYAYNAAGQRITEAEGGATTNLLYNGQQIIELRQGSTVTDQYVYNIDYVNDVLLRDDNSSSGTLGLSGSGLGRRLFAQHDANFDETALTNTSGVVVQREIYGAYGTMTILSPSWASATDAYSFNPGFQGMWQDLVTGLYYTPNRDYSTALGRWTEEDSGYWDGINLYQALDDGPASRVDGVGLDPQYALNLTTSSGHAIHLSAGVNVEYYDGGGGSPYFTAAIDVHRPQNYEDDDLWEQAAANYEGTAGENGSYPNLLLLMDWNAAGKEGVYGRNGDDHATVVGIDDRGDERHASVDWNTSSYFDEYQGKLSDTTYRSLDAQQQRRWRDHRVNDVSSDAMEFPLPECPGSGVVHLWLFFQDPKYFDAMSRGRFDVAWRYTGDRKFTYVVTQLPNIQVPYAVGALGGSGAGDVGVAEQDDILRYWPIEDAIYGAYQSAITTFGDAYAALARAFHRYPPR